MIYIRSMNLSVLDLNLLVALGPLLQPESDVEYLFWPVRHQNDPGSLWLRRHLISVGRDLDRQKRKAA